MTRTMEIRPEQPDDEVAISSLITTAFVGAEHSNGTEAEIVERLRGASALTLSLVASDEGTVVGHVAFSPVTIDDRDYGWFGLGPVAVAPHRQGEGIGASLVEQGLRRLRAQGANGCVVLGEPEYYARFGFRPDERLIYPGPPAEYFQALAFGTGTPSGTVAYHPAFG